MWTWTRSDWDTLFSTWSVLRMSWIFFSTGPRIRRRSWSESIWLGRASPPVEMSLRRRWRQSSAAPWRAWSAAGPHLQLKVSQTHMQLAVFHSEDWPITVNELHLQAKRQGPVTALPQQTNRLRSMTAFTLTPTRMKMAQLVIIQKCTIFCLLYNTCNS